MTNRVAIIAAVLVMGCTSTPISRAPTTAQAWRDGAESITADELLEHIKVLASDAFEGRAPGTAGEARTIEYLVQQFRRAGLSPGNTDGTWTQPVPATGFISTATFAVRSGSAVREMVRGREFAVRSRQLQPIVTVGDSEMVFLGYGIHAPQYGWDDYKEVDVRGKTLVMLEGEPPAPAVENAPPARLFRQAKASFWGTKSSKLDAAARKGAAAVLFIHEAEKSRTSFQVVADAAAREGFEIASDAIEQPVAIDGWITSAAFAQLCLERGDLASLGKSASERSF